jgi:hypothetical protein
MRRAGARAGALALVALLAASVLSACGAAGTPSSDSYTTTTSTTTTSTTTTSTAKSGHSSAASSPFTADALSVVAELAFGNFAPIEAAFDPTVKGQLSQSDLAAKWTAFEATFGDYLSHGVPIPVKRAGDLWVERVPVTMAHNKGEVRVTYDHNGAIAGLYFLKVGVPI